MSEPAPMSARWNTVTGAVWVCAADGATVASCSGEAFDPLAAYDAVAAAGFRRSANWLILPGMPHMRCLDVTPAP